MSKFDFGSAEEALDNLYGQSHSFVSKDYAKAIATALGVEQDPPVEVEMDTRWAFKGLTLRDADGYYDLHEFRKWLKKNWEWIKETLKPGTTQTWVGDHLWMMYTKPEPDGYGLEGVPYAEGIESQELATWLCRMLGLEYVSMHGRGFQLKTCVESLRKHFDLEAM